MMFFLRGFNFFLAKIDEIFFSSPVVLTYHSVSDGKTPISVHTKEFRRQMDFLKSNQVRVLTVRDFLDVESGKVKSRGKSALITFDDAFRDVFLNAMPILRSYGFPAVVFINDGLVGKRAEFSSRPVDKDREICSLSDLRELEAAGIAIANHSHSHKQLSELAESDVFSEYEKTADFIRNNFRNNSFPEVFVFPKGAKNEKVKSFLRSRGARVLDRRIDIYSDTSLFKFMLKLSNFYLWLRSRAFLLK